MYILVWASQRLVVFVIISLFFLILFFLYPKEEKENGKRKTFSCVIIYKSLDKSREQTKFESPTVLKNSVTLDCISQYELLLVFYLSKIHQMHKEQIFKGEPICCFSTLCMYMI